MQDIAETAWAFAMLCQLDGTFVALARPAELRVIELKAKEVANTAYTAWAFATLLHLDEKLFAELEVQEIATASAFATMGLLDMEKFATSSQPCREAKRDEIR